MHAGRDVVSGGPTCEAQMPVQFLNLLLQTVSSIALCLVEEVMAFSTTVQTISGMQNVASLQQPKHFKMNRSVDTIIFNLRGFLIDWNPRYVYRKIFKREERQNGF